MPQSGDQCLGRAEPLLRLLGEALLQNPDKGIRMGSTEQIKFRGLVDHLVDQPHQRIRREGYFPAGHLIHDHPDGIDIAPDV